MKKECNIDVFTAFTLKLREQGTHAFQLWFYWQLEAKPLQLQLLKE